MKIKEKIVLYISLILALSVNKVCSQDSTLKISGGICINKMVGFYFMNGVSGEISTSKILKGKVDLGLNITTSSLGSAFVSNAIPVHSAELYIQKVFRNGKHFRPLIVLNAGYAKAFYGSKIYDNLPQSSLLVSPEFGMRYAFNFPIVFNATLGYNVISGNGVSGAGFIYPVYIRFKALYAFGKK
ncbi:MAG: hypothetical protein IPI93_07065 [Sphingobacteriaceae bacterium]|nr:hypothetical protein [Sphingobacteriaceae bacterium]MBK7817640.1 hypothetical protein [Sphingobacteriaceae bacterium]